MALRFRWIWTSRHGFHESVSNLRSVLVACAVCRSVSLIVISCHCGCDLSFIGVYSQYDFPPTCVIRCTSSHEHNLGKGDCKLDYLLASTGHSIYVLFGPVTNINVVVLYISLDTTKNNRQQADWSLTLHNPLLIWQRFRLNHTSD